MRVLPPSVLIRNTNGVEKPVYRWYFVKVCSQDIDWIALHFWTRVGLFQWECLQRMNWLSTNRPSFAAANQVVTLTHVTNERVV